MSTYYQSLLLKPISWGDLDNIPTCLSELQQHLENTIRAAEMLEFCHESHFPISDNTLKRTYEIYTGLVTDIFLIAQTQCERWFGQNLNETQLAGVQAIQKKASHLREVTEKILNLVSAIAKPSPEKEKLKAMLEIYNSHPCINSH